jgi:DNA-binding response OmpR family regulator
MVGEYLQDAGFHFSAHASGDAVLQVLLELKASAPDALILDVMMPGTDGLQTCQRLRHALPTLPILMLTAKGDPLDRIIGLELGADDYLSKPFEPRELLARLKALLRRAGVQAQGLDEQAQGALRFGSLMIDPNTRTVRLNEALCELTAYQFDLLYTLAQRAGRVLTRDQIMEAVRGRELEAFDRSIDVHIGRIRQAIETDVKNPQRILTVRGVGYVLAKEQV